MGERGGEGSTATGLDGGGWSREQERREGEERREDEGILGILKNVGGLIKSGGCK